MVEQMSTSNLQHEAIEIELLLIAIHKKYGYDFSQYAQASLKRRLREFIDVESVDNFIDVLQLVLYDKKFFMKLLDCLTVNFTSMFRDPFFYRDFRQKVVAMLKTYPSIKIWNAGCSSGQEVYSLAILLQEEGLLSRCRIYATDIDDNSLKKAEEGVYSLRQMREYTENYLSYQGRNEFTDYYRIAYQSAIINQELKKQMMFTNHNLVTDGEFGKFHVILCRNVMIYFSNELQEKVLNLFDNSLITRGFLCLGMQETLGCTQLEEKYEVISQETKIYRKRGAL